MHDFTLPERQTFAALLELALREDLAQTGDVTTLATIPAEAMGQAVFVARREGILAGIPAIRRTLERIAPTLRLEVLHEDGSRIEPGWWLARITGPLRSILMAERTALNFLQHLSGIATLTRQFVDAVASTKAIILDTRKTLPGWRALAKYAVRMGGGTNHRLGLHDGILIKDNHLAGMRKIDGGTGNEIETAIRCCREKYPALAVEIEVDSLVQLERALACRPSIVLLDNMSLDQLRTAVALRDASSPTVLLEASGGVTLETVRGISETGVDRISIGALTHSAPALDIGLDYLEAVR